MSRESSPGALSALFRPAFPVLAAFLFLFAAGCCTPRFRLEDMRAGSLRTPYDTLDYFFYALRLEDWDSLYSTFSARTREYIDEHWFGRQLYGKFFAAKELEEFDPHAPEALRQMLVVDLIHRAEVLNVVVDDEKRRATVYLYYPPLVEAVPLIDEGTKNKPAWRVGIAEWLERRKTG